MEQTTKYQTKRLTKLTDVVPTQLIDVNKVGKGERIILGSRKEWQERVLSENWSRDNGYLSSLLGVTPVHVSRLRARMRSNPKMLEIAFDDYMTLKSDPEVPKYMRFNNAVKMLTSLLSSVSKDGASTARSVLIRIIDDVKAVQPTTT